MLVNLCGPCAPTIDMFAFNQRDRLVAVLLAQTFHDVASGAARLGGEPGQASGREIKPNDDAMVPALARLAPISIGSSLVIVAAYVAMNSGEPNRPGRRTSFCPRLR